MWWWLVLLVLITLIGIGAHVGGKRVQEVEEDSNYIYAGTRGPYGEKFLLMWGGYNTDDR